MEDSFVKAESTYTKDKYIDGGEKYFVQSFGPIPISVLQSWKLLK